MCKRCAEKFSGTFVNVVEIAAGKSSEPAQYFATN
jgi:hypothetical protein